jgi:hypothetical protein
MSLSAYTAKTWTDYADSPDLSAANVQYIDTGVAAVTAEVLALEAALPSTYQPISAELSALAGLSSTGYAKRTGAGAWSVGAIPAADLPSIALTGEATGSGASGSIAVTLTTASVTGKALTGLPAVTNVAIGAGDSILAAMAKLQGQINDKPSISFSRTAKTFFAAPNAANGAASFRTIVASDLPTSGVTAGTYGSASMVPVPTVDAYGRVTGMATATITPAAIGAQVAGSYEAALGNPGSDGYLLSSTVAGARSWVAPYSHPATHPQSVVDSASGWITTALAGKQVAGSYAQSTHTHVEIQTSRIAVGCYDVNDAAPWVERTSRGNHFGRIYGISGVPGYYNYVMLAEILNGVYGAFGWSSDGNWYLGRAINGQEISAYNSIWHSGNFTPGNYQPLDADLTAASNLKTTGFVRRTAADTWAASAMAWSDISGIISYGTTAGTVTQGNDSRLSDARTPTAHVLDSATHTISGKTAGQILLATDATTYGFTTVSGDATLSGSGALTLASTITASGPIGSASVIPVITYDSKGRLTSVATAAITPASIGAATSGHTHSEITTSRIAAGCVVTDSDTWVTRKARGNHFGRIFGVSGVPGYFNYMMLTETVGGFYSVIGYSSSNGWIVTGGQTTENSVYNTLWHSGNLTNLSQLTNGPGYITSSSVPLASSTVPSSLGTAAVGTGTTWARADHIHAMPTAAQVGAQASSAVLTNVSAITGQGFAVLAAGGGWTARSIGGSDLPAMSISGEVIGTSVGSAFSATITQAGVVQKNLSGLAAPVNSSISSSDTILSAMSKLQGQIGAKANAGGSESFSSVAVNGMTIGVINSPTGWFGIYPTTLGSFQPYPVIAAATDGTQAWINSTQLTEIKVYGYGAIGASITGTDTSTIRVEFRCPYKFQTIQSYNDTRDLSTITSGGPTLGYGVNSVTSGGPSTYKTYTLPSPMLGSVIHVISGATGPFNSARFYPSTGSIIGRDGTVYNTASPYAQYGGFTLVADGTKWHIV